MNNKVAWFLVICIGLGLSFSIGRINGMVYGGLFGGRVIDDATQQPVVGAYVIATWDSRTFHQGHCVHMDIETTDEYGEFFFSPWIDFVNHTVLSQDRERVLVYLPGLEQVSHSDPFRVRRHDDAPKERIEEIIRVSSQFCGSGSTKRGLEKAHIREAMYREAKKMLGQISHDPEGMYAYRVEFLKRKCGKRCQ